MTNCAKCNIRIVSHLWIIDGRIYCSLRCQRGKDTRYSDKVVNKIGCAGLKKEKNA